MTAVARYLHFSATPDTAGDAAQAQAITLAKLRAGQRHDPEPTTYNDTF